MPSSSYALYDRIALGLILCALAAWLAGRDDEQPSGSDETEETELERTGEGEGEDP